MTYLDVEPNFTIRRDRGICWAEVQYGTWNGRPETYEARVCLTPWGARRVGRRECERIRRERQDPQYLLVRAVDASHRELRNDCGDPDRLAGLLATYHAAFAALDEHMRREVG